MKDEIIIFWGGPKHGAEKLYSNIPDECKIDSILIMGDIVDIFYRYKVHTIQGKNVKNIRALAIFEGIENVARG